MSSETNLRQKLSGHVLKFPIGDINNIRKYNINAGYLVVLSTMIMIETVACILYKKGAKASKEEVKKYFMEYLYIVDSNYNPCLNSNTHTNTYTFGSLLYEYLRCKLGHDSNAIEGFPVEAQDKYYAYHLYPYNGSILIHAYHLYDDFIASLEYVYEKAASDSQFLRIAESGIVGYLKRLSRESVCLKKKLSLLI